MRRSETKSSEQGSRASETKSSEQGSRASETKSSEQGSRAIETKSSEQGSRASETKSSERSDAWWSARERWFLEAPDSPLTPDARRAFKGIPRWPDVPKWRVDAVLVRIPPTPGGLGATGPDTPKFVRVGYAMFTLEGRGTRLTVFEPEGPVAEPYIFIPFRDATSGKETYRGGRYIDTDPPGEDGRFTLDFNRSYHPFCVYDDACACTVPPPENVLDVAVTAGERLP